MKRITINIIVIATMLLTGATNASAREELKNAGKTANEFVGMGFQSMEQQTTSTTEIASSDSADAKKSALLSDISYTAKVTYKTDANGDTLKNDDGTLKKFVYIYDNNGNAVDANTAKKMVSSRQKAYLAILAKVGGGAVLGVAKAFLSGKKKDAVASGIVGGIAGLALSGDDISKIKKINKQMKKYNEVIDEYQSNFNDEGTPKDASVDLAKIYPDAEEVTKSASAIDAEIAASKTQIDPLEDFDPEKI